MAVFLEPGGDGFVGELQAAGDWADGQLFVLMKGFDLVEDKLVNHGMNSFQ